MAKTIDDIQNILIIGAGTMGLRIGLRCALDGYQVKMYDLGKEQLEKALAVQDKLIKANLKRAKISREQAERAKANISITTSIKEAVKNVDLVSESVIEDIAIKKDLYLKFAPHFEKDTILTTNTSYLLPSMFAEDTGNSSHFCALHFHDVFTANVLDVMPHPDTADWIPPLLMKFGKTINHIPVLVEKESPGYIYNAMLMAIIGSAGDLLTKGVASIKDIDRSWMGNMKMYIGPFGMLDAVGLDTAYHITKVRSDSRSIRFAALLKSYVDQGKLGVKSGEGFYTYPNPAYVQEGFI